MRIGIPTSLFEGPYARSSEVNDGLFDVSPDGQRFLMIRKVGSAQGQVVVVLNWFEELTRLVPTE